MYPFIQLFGLKIPSYGLMMAIALTVAILMSYFRAKKAGLDLDRFSNLAIIAVISGLVGAYLLYIFVTYPISQVWASIKDGSFSVFKNGGLVFYGAVIGGFLGALIYLKIKKQSFLEHAAVIVVTIPLAHAIGRVGCFLAGCCFGREIDTCISVIYTNPIGDAPVGVPVFPVQLLESCLLLIIFALLLIYTRKNYKRISALFLYMLVYGVERFIIEFFRADTVRGIFFGLSTSQWISIALVVGGAVGMILALRKEKRMKSVQPAAAAPEEIAPASEESAPRSGSDDPASAADTAAESAVDGAKAEAPAESGNE